MKRFYLFITLVSFLVAGCRSSKVVLPESEPPPSYSITYIIHGDANYLYHDAEGHALQADKQVLEEAKKIARNATNGEVFIFYQKPERKILWLFPKKDRQFLYYRKGKLVHEQKYSPHSGEQPFVTEAKLYQQFYAANIDTASHKNVILYFGHEVPHNQQSPYHYSRPNAAFNTQNFARGMQSFLQSQENKFDLTVLSTCNNGTPAMVHALSPYTHYILASPQNLHLSHIDTQSLALLDTTRMLSTKALAGSLAEDTYNRLSSFLQTVITLSVYDTDAIQSYIGTFNQNYTNYVANQPTPQVTPDNVDCATLSFFKAGKYNEGIKVWYKAPRFGLKDKHASYSGWGCRESSN